MEYLSKVLTQEELTRKNILINEYLGASCDLFLSDLLRGYSSYIIFSLYKLSSEYPTSKAFSLLESPDAYTEACTAQKEVLIIDGWNLRTQEYLFPSVSVILINRSITSPVYKEMYKAYTVIQIRPLMSRSFLYTHSLSILVRDKGMKIDLLYKDAIPLSYIETGE